MLRISARTMGRACFGPSFETHRCAVLLRMRFPVMRRPSRSSPPAECCGRARTMRPLLAAQSNGACMRFARMGAGALRKQRHAGDDDGRQNSRRVEPAEGEAAIAERLVEQVAEGGAERP